MRVQFEFSIKEIPLAYRLGTLSIIKEMIHKGSNDYYQLVFNDNKGKMKPFTHASYIKGMNVNKNEINGERLILTVSSPSYEFIMHLLNGSQRKSIYEYKGYIFELLNKRLLPKPPKFTETVLFKSASPILIENEKGQPLSDNSPGFERELNYYASLIAEELNGRKLYKPIEMIDSKMKKIVIKENLHHIQDKYIYLTANHGFIKLKGHQDDLRMLYDCGIGLRRSLGMGLLDVEEVKYP